MARVVGYASSALFDRNDPFNPVNRRIDIRIVEWRELVPVLVAAGLVTTDAAPTVTRALDLLAQQGDDPDILNLPLAFQQGRMSLGPLPLGPAPYLN